MIDKALEADILRLHHAEKWPIGTIATQLSPGYPQQFPDVSYGIEMQVANIMLVASNTAALYRIPTNAAEDAPYLEFVVTTL